MQTADEVTRVQTAVPVARITRARLAGFASRAPWMLAAVIGLGVGVPLILAFVTGSVSIPHNDAWAYSRIAATFGRGDGFVLVGWNRLGLFGQVVPLGPLGRWVTVQAI